MFVTAKKTFPQEEKVKRHFVRGKFLKLCVRNSSFSFMEAVFDMTSVD